MAVRIHPAFKTVTLVAVAAFGLSCGGSSGGSSGSKPLSLPSLPLAPSPTGCSGTAVGGVEVNLNTPMTVNVFGETFNSDTATGQSPLRIQRNAAPCEYELTGQLRPGNFNFQIGFTRTTDPRNDTGGVESATVAFDQGATGTPSTQNPCLFNVNSSNGNFRVRFKVVASSGCRGGTP